ncbi:glycosyltransferase family 2 protein [Arthrobacter sp. B3I4]|uniref:glycosyltransferase n=1 Tax=Arthrobacter sp. B3I4 TaxID=3042267 RepID=UPI0027808380|nr:glycosyltransferase [Arthrobacter sp. B3I4]MDQ0755764.1 glycosyltransferase involved in cell wall biosynthesis [Arthrobacter sp. B3I4]
MTTDQLPYVSVVVPAIRLDSWLDQALDSLLRQDGVELQLIVILDGVEEDGHRPWMEERRVTVLRNPTRLGVGSTLRRAMAEARGEFVARLDADDIAKPGRLREQAAYLRDHQDTVAVTSQTELIDDLGKVTGTMAFGAGPDVRSRLLLQNVVVQSAVMFRLGAYQLAGGYEPLRQMEDYLLWLRLAQHGKIAILPQTLAQYRVHGAQLSRGAKPFGSHISQVLTERRNLRKNLGAPALEGWAKDATWLGVQYLRYYVFTPLRGMAKKAQTK